MRKDPLIENSTEQDLIQALNDYEGISVHQLIRPETYMITDIRDNKNNPRTVFIATEIDNITNDVTSFLTINDPNNKKWMYIGVIPGEIDCRLAVYNGNKISLDELELSDMEEELRLVRKGLSIMEEYRRLPFDLRQDIREKYIERVSITYEGSDVTPEYGSLEMILDAIDRVLID